MESRLAEKLRDLHFREAGRAKRGYWCVRLTYIPDPVEVGRDCKRRSIDSTFFRNYRHRSSVGYLHAGWKRGVLRMLCRTLNTSR